MSIDANTHKNWSPYRALAVITAWLALVVVIALALVGGCGPVNPPPTADGSISLVWSITDQDGRPASCAQVSARSVALRLRNRADGGIAARAFPCDSSPGSAQAPPGLYDITLELHAADGAKLAQALDQRGVAIAAGRVTILTPATFAASTRGTMVISIVTPSTTNCQSPTAGGAGITGTTVQLEVTNDGCAAVTFERRVGTTPHGSYVVNCSSPQIAPCIEKNETLTTSLPAGSYVIRVRGKVGAVTCWQRDDTLVVPGPDKPLIHAVGLMRQNVPGC